MSTSTASETLFMSDNAYLCGIHKTCQSERAQDDLVYLAWTAMLRRLRRDIMYASLYARWFQLICKTVSRHRLTIPGRLSSPMIDRFPAHSISIKSQLQAFISKLVCALCVWFRVTFKHIESSSIISAHYCTTMSLTKTSGPQRCLPLLRITRTLEPTGRWRESGKVACPVHSPRQNENFGHYTSSSWEGCLKKLANTHNPVRLVQLVMSDLITCVTVELHLMLGRTCWVWNRHCLTIHVDSCPFQPTLHKQDKPC